MKYRKSQTFLLVVLLISLLSACATPHQFTLEPQNAQHQQWLQSVINYKNSSDITAHNLSHESQLNISDEMRQIVLENFSHIHKDVAAGKLSRWLMNSNGHNMQYDLNADLFPIDAFNQRRGNCLSFTILLVKLAEVLDIKLDYNDVHLPNTWGLADKGGVEQRDIILFRHINAVSNNKDRTKIYDLAIEEYNFGYPQKIISEEEATASLHSNIATQKLQQRKYGDALHHIRFAISLYPHNPDFWINLGVTYKRSKQLIHAENSFLHALNIKDSDSLAASNLETLYREQGDTTKAEHFKKLAFRARQKNPYLHYQSAQNYVTKKRYKLAEKSIKKAQRLHNKDPRFFVLSSLIAQHNKDYIRAIKDIQHAYTLTVSAQDRTYFSKKARLLAIKAVNTTRGVNAFSNREFNDSGLFNSTDE